MHLYIIFYSESSDDLNLDKKAVKFMVACYILKHIKSLLWN